MTNEGPLIENQPNDFDPITHQCAWCRADRTQHPFQMGTWDNGYVFKFFSGMVLKRNNNNKRYHFNFCSEACLVAWGRHMYHWEENGPVWTDAGSQ